MTTPTPSFNGRKLPLNDFEGDDHTPGADGHYVTCVDTSLGRMVAYATNGLITKDGSAYRSSLTPPDPDGISFSQAAIEAQRVAKERLVIPRWDFRECNAQLVQGRGLMVIGQYSTLPRAERYQDAADFLHCIFVPCLNANGLTARVYDPLNPDKTRWGAWMPVEYFWPFVRSKNFMVAYVPLTPIKVPPVESGPPVVSEPVFNNQVARERPIPE